MQTRNIKIPSNLINELGVPQIIDITDDLPHLPGGGWNKLNSPRKPQALTDIAWHHSAVFLADGGDAYKHANNHVRNGEGGCPYHFLIKDGQIYQCNDILTFTYGVASNNYQTVHCCVEGCYAPVNNRPADQLSGANRGAMIALELTLRELLPNYQRTNGHNYYKPTACPGYSMTKFKEEVDTVLKRIQWKQSTQARDELAYRIANSILWTYNMAQGKDQYGNTISSGDREWAVQRLLLLEPALREHQFIKD